MFTWPISKYCKLLYVCCSWMLRYTGISWFFGHSVCTSSIATHKLPKLAGHFFQSGDNIPWSFCWVVLRVFCFSVACVNHVHELWVLWWHFCFRKGWSTGRVHGQLWSHARFLVPCWQNSGGANVATVVTVVIKSNDINWLVPPWALTL